MLKKDAKKECDLVPMIGSGGRVVAGWCACHDPLRPPAATSPYPPPMGISECLFFSLHMAPRRITTHNTRSLVVGSTSYSRAVRMCTEGLNETMSRAAKQTFITKVVAQCGGNCQQWHKWYENQCRRKGQVENTLQSADNKLDTALKRSRSSSSDREKKVMKKKLLKLTEEVRSQSLDITHLKDSNEHLRRLSVSSQRKCSLAEDEIQRLTTQIDETSCYFCNDRQREFSGHPSGHSCVCGSCLHTHSKAHVVCPYCPDKGPVEWVRTYFL